MLVLERQVPQKLIVLDALLRRLNEQHLDYDYFKDLYFRTKVGYEGELRADLQWKELNITEDYFLFHGFECENHVGYSHQIDTMFICPHFILLLEIKNLSGRIDIDTERHQLLRTKSDGTIEAFTNPIDQINRHTRLIKYVLTILNISIPVEYGIVVVQPSTIIGTVPNHIPIFHLSGLETKIANLFNKHSKPYITKEECKRISSKLFEIHKQKNWTFQVNPSHLQNGVLCRNCNYKSTMKFNKGLFYCPKCNDQAENSVFEALHDYQLLIKNKVSNLDFREFLNIPSIYAANRLLKKLNLPFEGVNRGRIYHIPENILEKSDY